jgi:uncharacterized membrane protein YkvA (DUF1232 family)
MGVMASLLSRVSLVRTLASGVKLAVRLMREPQVPLPLKVIIPAAIVYIFSPLDFIPDVLPVIGELDDLGILVLALAGFLRLCPTQAVEFHRRAIAEGRRYSPMRPSDDYIDAEYRL